jgi:hypothetical protein
MHDQYLQALKAGSLQQQQQQQHQQQQQGSIEALGNACRLPPMWRTNHIFASSTTDECPAELIPGSWMAPGKVNGVGGMLPMTAGVSVPTRPLSKRRIALLCCLSCAAFLLDVSAATACSCREQGTHVAALPVNCRAQLATFMNNSQPVLRYAVCCSLGQWSEQRFSQQVLA